MKHWYEYRSKDRKVRGIIPARDKEQVARLAGLDIKNMVIEQVGWDGKRFVKCQVKK